MKESERRLLIARLHRVQARLRRAQRQILRLEAQAIRDSMTGVYNRPFLLEELNKETARSRRQQSPVGLLFVDVDGFKTINDGLGHLVGDRVLKHIAGALSATLRQADILARYGGDEFLILPMCPNEAGLVRLAERLRFAVEQQEIEIEGTQVSVTVSIGGTIGVPSQSDDDFAQRLLAEADAAMYDAKRKGRNRVVFRSMLAEADRVLIQRTIDCSFSRWLSVRKIVPADAIEELLTEYSPERLHSEEPAGESHRPTDEDLKSELTRSPISDVPLGNVLPQNDLGNIEHDVMRLAWQRENPIQFARLLIAKNLLDETQAIELVKQYLASLK